MNQIFFWGGMMCFSFLLGWAHIMSIIWLIQMIFKQKKEFKGKEPLWRTAAPVFMRLFRRTQSDCNICRALWIVITKSAGVRSLWRRQGWPPLRQSRRSGAGAHARPGRDRLQVRQDAGNATPVARVTRRLQGSQWSPHNGSLGILARVWVEEQQFPPRRRTSPQPHWKGEWGSVLFGIHLLQTGKYAEVWFTENPAIVQNSTSPPPSPFFPRDKKNVWVSAEAKPAPIPRLI